MIADTEMRNQILRKIERMTGEQLSKLDKYLKKLASEKTKKDRILSYAGTWKNLDDDIFREFTTDLISRRHENKRRTNEKSTD